MKGGHVTLDQLAAQWLLRSSKIFQNPFLSEAYVAVLKEAEELLWAGSEMDPVSFEPPSFSFLCCSLNWTLQQFFLKQNFSLWTQVRDMVKKLIDAKKWAEGIRNCLSKVENWSNHCGVDLEKIHFQYVEELLSFNPVPCNEPGHLKLKVIMV